MLEEHFRNGHNARQGEKEEQRILGGAAFRGLSTGAMVIHRMSTGLSWQPLFFFRPEPDARASNMVSPLLPNSDFSSSKLQASRQRKGNTKTRRATDFVASATTDKVEVRIHPRGRILGGDKGKSYQDRRDK